MSPLLTPHWLELGHVATQLILKETEKYSQSTCHEEEEVSLMNSYLVFTTFSTC